MSDRILVIADDFTGAAEMAGIGARFRIPGEIVRQPPFDSASPLLIIDTHSRHLSPTEASHRVKSILSQIPQSAFRLVYKKIDSLLRGPVIPEIQVAMSTLNRRSALLAPANPSRGRTIRAGEYFINDLPLHHTPLANDPEYPRHSARISDLIGNIPANIRAPDLASVADTHALASTVDSTTLPVGGADFFTALLEYHGFTPSASRASLGPGKILLICGTLAAPSRQAIQSAIQQGVPAFPHDTSPTTLQHTLTTNRRAILTTGPTRSQEEGETILQSLAQLIRTCLTQSPIEELLIEGGATSAAILHELAWHRFHDFAELAPGVVRMRANKHPIHITVKPGSYPWPSEVWRGLIGQT